MPGIKGEGGAMSSKAFLFPVSFYGKISVIISMGIILTAIITLNVAYRGAQRISLEHSMAAGKTNMAYVENQLLDIHTHINAVCDKICNSSEIRALFTIAPDAPPAELGVCILKARNRVNDLWDSSPLDGMVFTAVGKNGHAISSDDWGLRISNARFMASPVIGACRENTLALQYVPLQESFMGSDGNTPSLVAVRCLRTSTGRTPFGILMVQFSQVYFNSICKLFSYPQSHFLITDAKGCILSGSSSFGHSLGSVQQMKDSRIFTPFSAILAQNDGRGEGVSDHIKIGNTDNIVLYQYVPYMKLYLFNVIDREATAKDFYSSISGALLLAVLLTTVILLLAALITKGITRPLKRFTAQLLQAQGSGQTTRLTVEGSHETRRLAEAYNHMAHELERYNEKLLDTEKERHKAELTALQLQINPHFLYNTLASIKFLALKGNSDLAGKAIHSLTAMLRNTIGNTDELETVREQMENLKYYTDIMSLRYDDRIPVFYIIHPGCLTAIMPKLLLQPMVENAFFHAFDEAGGYIKILAALTQEGRLVCEIMDNGKGFTAPCASQGEPAGACFGAHIGLINIRRRLTLIYGDRSSFTVTSHPGGGTFIRLELPFRPDM